MTYPTRPVDIGGFLLPADRRWSSVTPPATTTPRWDPTGRWANRVHLTWGAGPHSYPARSHACLIADAAILHVVDALPVMDLDGHRDDVVWRFPPFHRCLVALPVTFPTS